MTPDQERDLLAATVAGLDAELRDAYRRLLKLISDGTPPRDAVQQVIESFAGEMASTLSAAFSAILAEAVGTADVMDLLVGPVTLSRRLYAEAQSVSDVVSGVVDRHTRGFQDARDLALDLFEGYGFREPGAEPLQFNRRNDKLPRYMREALLSDRDIAGQIERALARLQVDGLKTQALRAAYAQALDSLNRIESEAGRVLLEKRIEVAFFERMRYFAGRIAQTELHRAYAHRQAVELLADEAVEFVQWRMAPSHSIDDICDYFARVNRYGLGPGVYPKQLAPVAPAHPYCRCVLAPRLDLTGRKARENDGADLSFFRGLDLTTASRVAGSNDKLEQVMRGADPLAVHNARIDPQYRVRTVEQAAAGGVPG